MFVAAVVSGIRRSLGNTVAVVVAAVVGNVAVEVADIAQLPGTADGSS